MALGELRLLDSSIREAHLMHPFTEATMQRTVVVPYTFRDGLSLPLGISVNFTALQHSMDRALHGPDVDTFDPRRWVKRRQNFDTRTSTPASSTLRPRRTTGPAGAAGRTPARGGSWRT
ncbi:hypothetical protein diail_993 [Diaporthe ilicicola]|nr:hypothetical protein diail_993 [Diaporthe ilicicola]